MKPFLRFSNSFAVLGLATGLMTSSSAISPADAATATGLFAVTVNVQQNCTVDSGSLDFGTYLSGQADTVATTGSISYSNCNAATINVALDGGQAGDENNRAMTDGSGNSLNYVLFQDSARTVNWGTGANAPDLAVAAGGSGTWPVYGRIIREQSVPAGTYTDSVNITLTF